MRFHNCARSQYQAPTISDPTLFAQDYNIRPRTWHLQSQTPRFSCETTIMIRNPRTLASLPKIHFSGNLSAAHIYEPDISMHIYCIEKLRYIKRVICECENCVTTWSNRIITSQWDGHDTNLSAKSAKKQRHFESKKISRRWLRDLKQSDT